MEIRLFYSDRKVARPIRYVMTYNFVIQITTLAVTMMLVDVFTKKKLAREFERCIFTILSVIPCAFT